MTFLVNQTKSYTLVVSTETGEMRLDLADELKENLGRMLAEADTSTDGLAAILDVLGADAAALLDAMGEIYGVGGELAGAYANGGPEALEALLAELAASGPGADLMERMGGNMDSFGFVEVPASDVSDILGYGDLPEGSNPFAFDPSKGNDGLMEGFFDREAGKDALPFYGLLGVGGMLVVMGAESTAKAAVKGMNAVNRKIDEVEETTQKLLDAADVVNKPNNDVRDEVTFIPANPDEGYINPLENPFGPEWTEDEALDPTYGQILTDPNGEDGPTGDEEPDPEAELDSLILTSPENVKDAVNAEQVQEAAEFGIVSTTLPVEPEPEFEFNFGDKPDFGGGENFTGAMDGDQVTGAIDGEQVFDAELQVEFVAEGIVYTEGTSNGVVDHKADDFQANVDTFDFV